MEGNFILIIQDDLMWFGQSQLWRAGRGGKNCPKPLGCGDFHHSSFSCITSGRCEVLQVVTVVRSVSLCDIGRDRPNCLKLSCIIHSFLLYDVSMQQN